MSRILLDTNVVLRLVDNESPQHELVRTAVETLAARSNELLLAPQVIIEFWVVATRPAEVNGFGLEPAFVSERIRQLRARFELLAETPELFDRWMELVIKRDLKGKRAHDARLAAIALVHRVDTILTLNAADFAGIDGLAALHPSSVG